MNNLSPQIRILVTTAKNFMLLVNNLLIHLRHIFDQKSLENSELDTYLFIAGGFGVKNNRKTRKFLKMWANLEIGHPQGKDMQECVLHVVSTFPVRILKMASKFLKTSLSDSLVKVAFFQKI